MSVHQFYQRLKEEYDHEIVQLEADKLHFDSWSEVRLLEVCLKQQRMINSLLPTAYWNFKKEGERTVVIGGPPGCTKKQAIEIARKADFIVDDSWTARQGPGY